MISNVNGLEQYSTIFPQMVPLHFTTCPPIGQSVKAKEVVFQFAPSFSVVVGDL